MKKSARIIAMVLTAVLCLTVLSGCGLTVDWVYSEDDEYVYYDISVSFPKSAVSEIEASASQRPDGRKWTVSDWLSEYMYLFGYDAVSSDTLGSTVTYRYMRKISLDDIEDDEDDEESTTTYTAKNLFYVYLVEVTMENPFNGTRKSYDEAKEGSTDMFSAIKYGVGGGETPILPALGQAFPALADKDVGETVLNFYLPASGVAGTSGTIEEVNGETYYRFERKFDLTDEYITYAYYRPCALGWYVTIIVIGGLVVFAIIFATRTKNKKTPPQVSDSFPYDPSEQSDSNLPGGYNGGFRY